MCVCGCGCACVRVCVWEILDTDWGSPGPRIPLVRPSRAHHSLLNNAHSENKRFQNKKTKSVFPNFAMMTNDVSLKHVGF